MKIRFREIVVGLCVVSSGCGDDAGGGGASASGGSGTTDGQGSGDADASADATGSLDGGSGTTDGQGSGDAGSGDTGLDGPLLEEQISEVDVVDFEFDWGRDGVHCTACNEGDGNSRFAFTDRDQNLWLGYINPDTGAFEPPDGRAVLLDDNSAFATDFGNGPEWMFSTGSSEIVYTKYLPGSPQSTLTASAAVATPTAAGQWQAGIMPGGFQRQSPVATLDLDDPSPRINFQDYQKEFLYWVDATDPWDPGAEVVVPISNLTGGGSRRWVPGTRALVFSGGAAPDENGVVYKQVYIYGTDAEGIQQLTFDPTNKTGVFMWRAPEFNNEYVFFTLSDRTKIKIYRKITNQAGDDVWTEINSINTPQVIPYIWSPEPFTYNGKSYIHMQLSSSADATDMTVPTQIAMTGIEPDSPSFKMLSNDTEIRRVRMDPEHYITTEGAFIYYNRYIPATDTNPVINDGVWRVDTQLGPPN